MYRTSHIAEKLLAFDGNQAYLRCKSSKLRIYVIRSAPVMFTGNDVPISKGDKVIIAWHTDDYVGVSASIYCGFGIFEEKYYENNSIDEEELLYSDFVYRTILQSASTAVSA